MTIHDGAMCPDCTCPSGACDRHVGLGVVCCGHDVEWHHSERGCQYHGNGPNRCPCVLTGNQYVAAAVQQHHAAEVTRLRDRIAFLEPSRERAIEGSKANWERAIAAERREQELRDGITALWDEMTEMTEMRTVARLWVTRKLDALLNPTERTEGA